MEKFYKFDVKISNILKFKFELFFKLFPCDLFLHPIQYYP